MIKLTAKQQKFIDYMIQGMTQVDAYKNAYGKGNMTDKSIRECSSRLMKHPKIQSTLTQQKALLAQELQQKIVWTREHSLMELLSVAKACKEADTVTDRNTRIRAMEAINKMLGYNEPDQLKIENDIRIDIIDD